MKKVLLFMIAVAVCFTVLAGCAQDVPTVDTQDAPTVAVQEESCRVEGIQEDGIVVYMPSTGYVYVKNVDSALGIKLLNTVVMKFYESDLKAEEGAFLDFAGKEQQYAYVLENPVSIRLADPASGEPTFG